MKSQIGAGVICVVTHYALLVTPLPAAPRHWVAIAEAEVRVARASRPSLPDDFHVAPQEPPQGSPTLLDPEAATSVIGEEESAERDVVYLIQSQANQILELQAELDHVKHAQEAKPTPTESSPPSTLSPTLPPTLRLSLIAGDDASAEPLEVTVFTAEDMQGARWCTRCNRDKGRYGIGNDRVRIHWSGEVAPGPQMYPAYRFKDASGHWRFPDDGHQNYRLPKDLDDLIDVVGRHQRPVHAIGAAGVIHGKARIDQAKAFIRDRIGERVPIRFTWDRTGLQTFPLLKAGVDWSPEAIFGRSGRITVDAKGAKLPVTAAGFAYRLEGNDLLVTADGRLQGFTGWLGQTPSQDAISAQPAGVDPMTVLTILSVIRDVWNLLHPTADLEIGGSVSATVLLDGDVLTVTFKDAPKLRITVLWQWLLGVDTVTVTADQGTIDFVNQPGVMFPIKRRTFSLVD